MMLFHIDFSLSSLLYSAKKSDGSVLLYFDDPEIMIEMLNAFNPGIRLNVNPQILIQIMSEISISHATVLESLLRN